MPHEIPQELLEEMIMMNSEQFDKIEKRWRENLSVKSEYERQYYNQLQGYLDYNKTFKENVRPLTPYENNLSIDENLLKGAKIINLENARQKAIQMQLDRNEIAQSFLKEKEQIVKIEKNPGAQIKPEPGQHIPLTLENPTPSQIGERAKEITEQLFAAMKYEALEREWETSLNYPANDLRPHDPEIEMEY